MAPSNHENQQSDADAHQISTTRVSTTARALKNVTERIWRIENNDYLSQSSHPTITHRRHMIETAQHLSRRKYWLGSEIYSWRARNNVSRWGNGVQKVSPKVQISETVRKISPDSLWHPPSARVAQKNSKSSKSVMSVSHDMRNQINAQLWPQKTADTPLASQSQAELKAL